MEEKKAIKISLSTFLLTIVIVVLCTAGFFMYKINCILKETNKNEEYQNQVNTLNENTVNNTTKNTNSVSTVNSSKTESETQKDDNGKYIGKWVDEDNESEINILSIGNGQLAFSWSIYRLAGIDNVVVPIENNEAKFYFQGYDDKNFNGVQDDGEHFYRKATIKLNNTTIDVKVENITGSEYDVTLEREFNGGVYIDEGSYTHITK